MSIADKKNQNQEEINLKSDRDDDSFTTTSSQNRSLNSRMQQQIKKYHYQSPKLPQKKYDGQNLQSLIYHKKWDQCISRINTHPHETTLVDKISGDLALHEACQSGAPFNVIQHLIHTNQSALSTKGFCGRIPLHYAVYVRPTVNVIKLLLRYYKDGAAVFDNDGRLPIHMAVLRNAPNLVIQTLIDANLRGLISCNKFGNTPDMVCNNDLVKALLKDEKYKKESHLNKEEGKIRNDKEGMGMVHHTQQNENGIVPLKDVTVMSDFNKMETTTITTTATTEDGNDDGNDDKSTTHGSTPHVVGSTRLQQEHSQNRNYEPQQQKHQQRQQQKRDKNLIAPTKGTIYRQMHNSVRTHPRSYEIPTPEQLIAWQFSSSADDNDQTSD